MAAVQAASCGSRLAVVAYDDAVREPQRLGGPHDVAVCNVAPLADDVAPLLAALRERLAAGGALVIQTVHPWTARGDAPSTDGWRTETFAAIGEGFGAPMPWHYRTLGSRIRCLGDAGYRVAELHEPTHRDDGTPLSLLMVRAPRG